MPLLRAYKTHTICIMQTRSLIQVEADEVSRLLNEAGHTQQELASKLGVSQSQVSRTLNGKLQRRTKLFDRLCIIAYRSTGPERDGRKGASAQQPELVAALDAVWDGTTSHAKALAVVIRSLGALKVVPGKLPASRIDHAKAGGRK